METVSLEKPQGQTALNPHGVYSFGNPGKLDDKGGNGVRCEEPKANRAVPVDTEELIAVFELWPGEGQRRVSDTKGLRR